jgi:hypothetical protein
MTASSFLCTFTDQPKKIFILDALGALISAVMLGIILPAIQPWIGMPLGVLRLLSIIPVVYLLYDLIVYYRARSNFRIFIRVIALLNLAYCILSVGLMLLHWTNLTAFGKLYFIGECLIIIAIASLEWKVAGSN